MLTQFDVLLSEYFPTLIQIDGLYDGLIVDSNANKYEIQIIAKDMSKFGFEDSRRYAAEEMQTNIFKLIAETIPYVDKNFKSDSNEYLNSNQIQLAMIELD
jgi:hypothetical protein